MKEKRKTVYYRFAEQLLKALKMAHVRRFPHKNNPKKYGLWANAVLFGIKQLEDKPYRLVVEMAAEMPNILSLLGINQAPHWTTLHKAVQRFLGSLVERLVAVFVRQTKSAKVRAGIDSTGLQPTRASAYYRPCLRETRKSGGKSAAISSLARLLTLTTSCQCASR